MIHNMHATADAMVANTIQDCLGGDRIELAGKDPMFEQCNYSTVLTDVRTRLLVNRVRPTNPVVAIARFVWLAAGSNRVEDIAYYEPKVRNFSDDRLSVPGSDYGMRLFQPRPGLNQLKGVVERLRKDPASRQAAAVVWQPEDAVRVSGDIPCTFGMFFNIRNNPGCPLDHSETDDDCRSLNMSLIMRSNNAFRILPFNIFEFTMLQEMVAAELGVPVGNYYHWASSMHVYDNANEIGPTRDLGALAGRNVGDTLIMDPMPANAFDQVNILCQAEAQLRHAGDDDDIFTVLEALSPHLDTYWWNWLGVLACWTAAKHQLEEPPYYAVHAMLRDQVQDVCQKAYK